VVIKEGSAQTFSFRSAAALFPTKGGGIPSHRSWKYPAALFYIEPARIAYEAGRVVLRLTCGAVNSRANREAVKEATRIHSPIPQGFSRTVLIMLFSFFTATLSLPSLGGRNRRVLPCVLHRWRRAEKMNAEFVRPQCNT
jgi:hypothetical protein